MLMRTACACGAIALAGAAMTVVIAATMLAVVAFRSWQV